MGRTVKEKFHETSDNLYFYGNFKALQRLDRSSGQIYEKMNVVIFEIPHFSIDVRTSRGAQNPFVSEDA